MGQNMKPSQILKMFPRKGWAIRTLQRVVGKIKYGEETIPGRRPGRDRPVQDPTLVAKASALFKFRWGYDKPWGGPACPKARLYEEAGPVRGKKLNLKSVAKVKGSRMSEKKTDGSEEFCRLCAYANGSGAESDAIGNDMVSDEKTFTAEPRRQGTRNDRVLIPKRFYAANCNFHTKFHFQLIGVSFGFCPNLLSSPHIAASIWRNPKYQAT